MAIIRAVWVLLLCTAQAAAEDNGLERTPAMGFMQWERFRCNTDCDNFPDECISERLFTRTADALVETGLRDAGYVYVAIDDCWASKNRTPDGRLQPDPQRFPSGMRYLSKYMHDRGLKFGIYGDYGTLTCAGYPGSQGFEQVDAETFADWGVDFLKFDGCYSNESAKAEGYIKMGAALNATGRPILYACSWPAYIPDPDYDVIARTCNQWRNEGDIQDSWDSVRGIIAAYAQKQDVYSKNQGPGHFNDPDELLVGNRGLSPSQQRVQMSVWSMWSAPLFVSADIGAMGEGELQLLMNRNLININQDPAGSMATRVVSVEKDALQTWVKRLTDPTIGLAAVCMLNQRTDDQTALFTHSLKGLGLTAPPEGSAFLLVDVFTSRVVSKLPLGWDEKFTFRVPAFDTVTVLVRHTIIQPKL